MIGQGVKDSDCGFTVDFAEDRLELAVQSRRVCALTFPRKLNEPNVTGEPGASVQGGGRTPGEAGMHPRTMPFRPSQHDLQDRGRRFPPNYLHDSWQDYLYWDTELDP